MLRPSLVLVAVLTLGGFPAASHANHPNNMLFITVGAILLIDAVGDECRTPEPVDYVISAIPHSLYTTHREIVRPWESTGRFISTATYEGARQPPNLGDLDDYVRVKHSIDDLLLRCLPAPYGRLAIIAKSAFQSLLVADDYRFREQLGLGSVWMMSFEWRF